MRMESKGLAMGKRGPHSGLGGIEAEKMSIKCE